uniref:Innexin n=2 Tax=Trichostrongylidae TaxID=6315 RepID=A0A912N1K6_HAECO
MSFGAVPSSIAFCGPQVMQKWHKKESSSSRRSRHIARSSRGHGRDSASYHHAAVVEVGAMVLQNMFSALSFLHYRKDDDFVDRLSYFYTSSFLIMMAVLVSFKQFGGRPLECWVPAQFTASWEAYTEMYCWAQNTYWVPIEQDIPVDIAEREYRQISYYQWVPFFLLIQAFLYYIPCLMWRLMSDKSGIRLNDIVQMATEKENIEPDYRIRTIESLSRHIESALRYQHTATSRTQYTLHRVFKCFNMRYYESYVTGMYLATKIMYVGNILTNLVLVNKFLETDDYSIYGLGVLRDLLFGRTWMESGNFPRVTLCDFEVRVLGNNQRHSVQCVLVINIFNEKIFILIWLWFTLLFVASTLDMLYWFSISMFHRDRFRFVLRHLELTSDPDKPELFRKEKRKQVEHFLRTYLKVDGVLVLRMIALHAGVMFCTEITDALWKRYLSQHPENLIDEDSSLLTFARAQSIRRKRHDSGSSTEGQNHQRLGRILSHRSTGGSFRLNRTGSTNRSLTESKTMPPQSPSATTATYSKVKPRRTVVTITSPSTDVTEPNGGDTIQEASKREGVPLAV